MAEAALTHRERSAWPLRQIFGSDLWWSFRRSRVTVSATLVAIVIIGGAVLAPWLAPHDPFDPGSLSLLDASNPPAWLDGGSWTYPLGTDNQGRDILSAILYGSRLSLMVGFSAVALAMLLGVTLGLVAGWNGGLVEAIIMRIADVKLSFPAILIALLIDGLARGVLPRDAQAEIAPYVLIVAIALSFWVQYARTVRASTLVERDKEYILAARIIGVRPAAASSPRSTASASQSPRARYWASSANPEQESR